MTRELAGRLPLLSPDRYAVARPPAALAFRAGHAWEQAVLPLAARRARVILCPANLAPLSSRRNALLIHDLAALRHPEWYGRAYAGYQRRLLPVLARRARLLITVSEFSRRELSACLGVAAGRIRVVANGVDERFSPHADPGPARAAHALERPYVLAVGTRIARKNLAALRALRGRLDELGLELVAAGSERGYMRAEGASPARPLGYVSEAHLPGLYAGASALVMPSLYEGFGLPCLEAMAAGTPVVASTAGALPDTCRDAALLVDPADRDGWVAPVESATGDEALRERLIAAGLERAREFSWDRSARLTDHLIAKLLDEGPA